MSFKQSIKKAVKKVFNGLPVKSWAASQSYELNHAILFMETPEFRQLAEATHRGDFNASKGYASDMLLREFFGGDEKEWDRFVGEIRGKACLEIGPSAYSPLACWDVASERHVIEPLYQPIERWQKEKLGFSVFEGLRCHSHGADILIPELQGKIDGAIYCRNCLDHSPHWPFILANISLFAAPGCKLLFWSDIDHGGEADEGHYDITSDTHAFRRLIDLFGFEVVREYQDTHRKELNWGCFAVKR